MASKTFRSDMITFPVIVIGYSNELEGGVVQVTRVLMKSVAGLTLHPMLYCYHPKWRAAARYVVSVTSYLFKQVFYRKALSHVIVGSQGDVYRVALFIIIGKLFRVPICIQYHKSADILFAGSANKPVLRLAMKVLFSAPYHCHLSEGLHLEFSAIAPKGVSRHEVIPNALEQKWFARKPLAWQQRDFEVVFFGRWSWEKGVDDLMACFYRLPSVKLDVFSHAQPDKSVSNVVFHSWASESEVRNVISRAKLVVLPSYSEAYPTVLLEALSCGTPFVASDLTGIVDIAAKSGGGMTFPVGNVASFRQTIGSALFSQDQWQTMSDAGAKWVRETHTTEQIGAQWEALYRRMWLEHEK